MLGYAFMGKAHSHALITLPHMVYPPPALPILAAIAGRDAEAVRAAAARYGYARAYTDWRDLVADPSVQLVDNGGPNGVHAEPSIAAAQAGKHVLCEKPLGRTAAEARAMLDAVTRWRQAHGRLQLPLCARRAPRVRAGPLGLARAPSTTSGSVSPGLAGPIPTAPHSWRLTREPLAVARWEISARTSSTWLAFWLASRPRSVPC